jgi:hypothetical protein
MSSKSLKQHMMDHFSTNPSARFHQEARRNLLRVDLPFPALVRGVNSDDQAFEERTVLDSLSAYDLLLHLRQPVLSGTRIFLVVRLSVEEQAPAPRVALRGIVERITASSDRNHTLVVMLTRYRFLYADGR